MPIWQQEPGQRQQQQLAQHEESWSWGVDVKDQLIECPLEMGANGTFEYHRSWSSKMKDSEDRWYHLDLPPHPGLQLQIKVNIKMP